jgi:hypothetical protein
LVDCGLVWRTIPCELYYILIIYVAVCPSRVEQEPFLLQAQLNASFNMSSSTRPWASLSAWLASGASMKHVRYVRRHRASKFWRNFKASKFWGPQILVVLSFFIKYYMCMNRLAVDHDVYTKVLDSNPGITIFCITLVLFIFN